MSSHAKLFRAVRGGIALAVLLTGACNPFHNRSGFVKKPVTAKEGVSVLVSGTARCFVPTTEFPKVQIGEQHACNWHDSGPVVPPK